MGRGESRVFELGWAGCWLKKEDFSALKEELGDCDEVDDRRRQEISELMVESQDRLSSLMDKMGQCFQTQVGKDQGRGLGVGSQV